MMRSMYAGVSGLKAHQTRMDVIGNNIANVNTVGYKSSSVTFKEMLSQTLRGAKAPQGGRGGVNPMQVGLGVGVGSITVDHTQGNLQPTGVTTDLAIQGNGYFVVNNGQKNLFTRAGRLNLDDNGYLVNVSNGFVIQGWMADISTGTINSGQDPENIHITDEYSIMNARATGNATISGNLDSQFGGTREITVDVLDSLGEMHTVTLSFTKRVPELTTTIGGWDLNFRATEPDINLNNLTIDFLADDDSQINASYNSGTNTVTVAADWDNSSTNAPADLEAIENAINDALNANGLASVDITATTTGAMTDFDGAGAITLSNPPSNTWDWNLVDVTDANLPASPASGTITFNPDGTINSGSNGSIAFDPTNGAATGQTINLDFSALTQLAEGFDFKINSDGYETGALEGFTIDDGGVITGSYSNGLVRPIGQIAIAYFVNPSGLMKEGETLFSPSENSGDPQIGEAGSGGRGKISVGNLEMSNVDLAEQFTDMITTQRGFQANSKIITTTDQMLQDLVNLKR
ncbi:flagellar hook protein FlgE, epsilon proteobacterial [Halothermothrix orenii H 168]|uniref:Flagellar hook protein FlgE n=2 Tax=Halothermothrix orenii TaxID=31909 RepID=B8CYR1_HALOH|nr:flagellar hook protein FlgE, epsilon proteobacterial [Halothermothrix orenii H 168]